MLVALRFKVLNTQALITVSDHGFKVLLAQPPHILASAGASRPRPFLTLPYLILTPRGRSTFTMPKPQCGQGLLSFLASCPASLSEHLYIPRGSGGRLTGSGWQGSSQEVLAAPWNLSPPPPRDLGTGCHSPLTAHSL